MAQLTHFDDKGSIRMVDVTDKSVTKREAVAYGTIAMQPETFQKILKKEIRKGNVLEVAKVAGIMAAKKTSDLIPMSHPINVTAVDISFHPISSENKIEIESKVKVVSNTGAEMEALMAVSITALTIYDMCKSIDREMVLSDIKLLKKSGGKSGEFKRGAL